MKQEVQALEVSKRPQDVSMPYEFIDRDTQVIHEHENERSTRIDVLSGTPAAHTLDAHNDNHLKIIDIEG
ncbi:unnamed protein product, partial [Rotaria magnacalcarata]